MTISLLGDARLGKLAGNVAAFGRALRRAGVPVDASRIALAQSALGLVDFAHKGDVAAAFQSTLVSREQDIAVFNELFEAFFKNPDVAQKLLSQMLPSAEGKAKPSSQRPRVREALNPAKLPGIQKPRAGPDEEVKFDATMTASDSLRLKHADFNALSAAEYALVQQLAQRIPLPIPKVPSRRSLDAARGPSLHWSATLQRAAHTLGEPMHLRMRKRRLQPLPLVALIDVSGSMERYARLLLAFLHAATAGARLGRNRRQVFSFGSQLTDLQAAFSLADTDAMLRQASLAIEDFAGGTQLGSALATLRQNHARKLIGGRSIVLLVSDGLDTGEPEQLAQELDWLKRHCKSLVWLNPLMRFEHYQPSARAAQVLSQRSDAMLAVHNLQSLEALAQALSSCIKP